MQMFYVIIGRDKLYLYEKKGEEYSRQYIAGNPEFHYQINNVKQDVEKMMDILVEEYNLENRSELSFFLIGNSDPFITETVSRALEGYIAGLHELSRSLAEIIKRFSEDEKLLVKEFGINFDGVNYCLVNGEIKGTDYSLLGYTLQTDDLIGFVG